MNFELKLCKNFEQFERNDVWTLVLRRNHTNIIGTKWIFKNKIDEFGNIMRIRVG